MGMELQQQANPTAFIEYNGYLFGTRTKSRLQIVPIKDSSQRTETTRKYVLMVSSVIVPRRNIPGDGTALNIQIPPPAVPTTPVPGLSPIHLAATVDSEIRIIIEKLTETGKTLRYIGQGVGDIVVNTLHPKTGQFIQDLNFGPHCRISKLEPVGFNKAYRIEWECEFHLHPGNIDAEGVNDLQKRILEYNYSVDYRYDAHGYCTRNIQGHIKIVPPMFRGLGSLPPTGAFRSTADVPEFTSLNDLEKDAISSLDFGGDVSRSDIQNMFYTLTSSIKKYKHDCLLMPFEAALNTTYITTVIRDIYAALGIIFKVEDADVIVNRFFNILRLFEAAYAIGGSTLAENVYKRNIKEADTNVQAFFYFRNYFVSGLLKKVPELRKYPEIADMFPSGTAPLDNKICYGPFAFDNIGNLQNYETVDQYKELIHNSIVIPFNFRREGQNWSIEQNKSTMRFSITDREYPPFSFVPGYSSVQAHQDTTSTGAKFIQFNTSISATFKMGKHIAFNKDFPPQEGYSDYYKTLSQIEGYNNATRQLPSKKQAYVDFLKLVFQRLAVPLLLHNRGINIQLEGPDKKRLSVKSGMTCIPHTFQCREDILSDTITYTLGYKLTSEINSFFVITGHGLPAIIASDLDITNQVNRFIAEAPDEVGVGRVNIEQRRAYVASILFSKYKDVCTHRDWLVSQKFSSNNPRGGSDIFFDRSFDRPINITVLGESLTRTIPLHGEYPNLKPQRALQEFKFDSKAAVVGLFGENVIRCLGYIISADGTRTLKEEAYVYQDGTKPTFTIKKLEYIRYIDLFTNMISYVVTVEDFNALKLQQDNIAKLQAPNSIYTVYHIFNATEFKSKYPKIKVPGLPLTNDDIDIFYEELANELPEAQKPAYKSTLTIPTIKFENEVEEGNSYDAVEDFVSQSVGDFITRPSAINSWLAYECDLKIETDNKIIRHKVLPQTTVLSDFGATEISPNLILNELIQSNHDAIFNTGPNSLKGGSPASDINLGAPQNTDIIQTINEPSHIIVLSGWAARIHYEVVAPTLLRYGGCPVIQKRRVFSKRTTGERDNQTHYGAWYIEYYVDGHPSGFLGTPSTPWQVNDEIVNPDNENVEDTLILEEQTNLLQQAASLIGFAVQ